MRIMGFILACLAVLLLTATSYRSEAPETPQPEIRAQYNVPLDEELQAFIASKCEEYHIDTAVVLAVIERESRFNPEAVGDSGKAIGLMQVQPRWHMERMARLDCYDLLDPQQNVTVGIDFLAELVEAYEGDVSMALVAFNAGQKGAYDGWFSVGKYESDYSRGVLERAQYFSEGVMIND